MKSDSKIHLYMFLIMITEVWVFIGLYKFLRTSFDIGVIFSILIAFALERVIAAIVMTKFERKYQNTITKQLMNRILTHEDHKVKGRYQ